MDGTFTWLYEYRSQMGKEGFFGTFDQAQNDGVANLGIGAFDVHNFYLGGFHKVNGNPPLATGLPTIWAAASGGQGTSLAGGESIVSGSDASWQIFWMSTNMQVRMNKAVRIRGNYFIGSWNSPMYSTSQGLMVSSGALTQDNPGVQRSFFTGILENTLAFGAIAMGRTRHWKAAVQLGYGAFLQRGGQQIF